MTSPAWTSAPYSRCVTGSAGGQHAAADRFGDAVGEQSPRTVRVVHLVPSLPAQDGGTFLEEDALHWPVEAGVQEGAGSGADPRRYVRFAGGYCRSHPLVDVLFDGVQRGEEQALLVGEVVVQSTAGDPGVGDDAAGRGGRVSLFGEQRDCAADQLVSSGRDPP